MIFLDTSVIVPALLARHPQHRQCFALLGPGALSSTHCLAETFAVITSAFRVNPRKAAELIDSRGSQLSWKDATLEDYQNTVRDAPSRGVQGGGIYDALHAMVARREKVTCIKTYNVTNFQHCAPDMKSEKPAED